MNIFIIWPWWVWKSTSWKILADRLWLKLIDLDQEFMKTIGNIWDYIHNIWYEKYYKKNSDLFSSLLKKHSSKYIFVLSSWFMTYTDELTKKHLEKIQKNWISILLLPSKSIKKSIDIVVKRQLLRWFDLDYEKEKNKIEARYMIYKKYWDIKIFSHNTPENIVNEMIENINNINFT
jgi:shikimate kinase